MRSPKSGFTPNTLPDSSSFRGSTALPFVSSLASELAARGISVHRGTTGDHAELPDFFTSAGNVCNWPEFQAQLEEPKYEPCDRLIVRHGPALVGHVRLSHHEMQYGPLRLPVAEISDLVVLPEYESCGVADVLLQAAESQLRHESPTLAIARTTRPALFESHGWNMRGQFVYSVARLRSLLATLGVNEPRGWSASLSVLDEPPVAEPFRIRLFRQVELDALARIYAVNAGEQFGWYPRDMHRWTWLISRRAFDRIYVATTKAATETLEEASAAIVAYIVMRDNRIVELMSLPDAIEAERMLLLRACRDALEQGRETIRIDGPPRMPLHELFEQAGVASRWHDGDGQQGLRMKLLGFTRFARRVHPLWKARLLEAGISLPAEIGLLLDGRRFQIQFGEHDVSIAAERLGRSYLHLSTADLSSLLWGISDWHTLNGRGRCSASTQMAAKLAEALFPSLPHWLPPLEFLPALD
ncbi:MAG: GNAT family N-acetyltransferase [Planctomycetales bacterium]|nr:GNAT family N-acetyltransferase [Planctomycetales bacterium]